MGRWLRALAAVVAASLCFGQAPKFEVASVKPSPPGGTITGSRGGPGTAEPCRWWAENYTFLNLLVRAYNVLPYQIARPQWMDSARFQIHATVPAGAGKEQLATMLQALLEERFRLRVHHETKELTVFDLVVAKNGPKLKSAAEPKPGEDLGEAGASNGIVRCTHRRCTMEMLATALSLNLRMPVMDATGLGGQYDVALSWASDPAIGPSLFTAVEEQLGLKLRQKKGPVEMLVVDSAEKIPTEN